MKSSTRSVVVHQPTNKKYLVQKTALEMKDQNDNQTEDDLKEEPREPFLIEQHSQQASEEAPRRKTIHCSDRIVELDENGNPIEEVKKRTKRSLKTVVKHRSWNVFDRVDLPVLHSASNIGSSVGRKTLSAIDYVGNAFASFLGITGSRYESEAVQANYNDKERERRDKVLRDAEAGWK